VEVLENNTEAEAKTKTALEERRFRRAVQPPGPLLAGRAGA
jgi:hypothetical protein